MARDRVKETKICAELNLVYVIIDNLVLMAQLVFEQGTQTHRNQTVRPTVYIDKTHFVEHRSIISCAEIGPCSISLKRNKVATFDQNVSHMLLASTEEGIIVTLFNLDHKGFQVVTIPKIIESPRVNCLKVTSQGRVFKVDDLKSEVCELSLDFNFNETGYFDKLSIYAEKIIGTIKKASVALPDFNIVDNLLIFGSGLPKNIASSYSKITIDETRGLLYALTQYSSDSRTSVGFEDSIVLVYDIGSLYSQCKEIRRICFMKDSEIAEEMRDRCRTRFGKASGFTIIEVSPVTLRDHPEVHLQIVFANTSRAYLSIATAENRTMDGYSNQEEYEARKKWIVHSCRLPLKISQLQDPSIRAQRMNVLAADPVSFAKSSQLLQD